MENSNKLDKAYLLIEAILTELERGAKHYNLNGELQRTPLDILNTIHNEGGIIYTPTTAYRTLMTIH